MTTTPRFKAFSSATDYTMPDNKRHYNVWDSLKNRPTNWDICLLKEEAETIAAFMNRAIGKLITLGHAQYEGWYVFAEQKDIFSAYGLYTFRRRASEAKTCKFLVLDFEQYTEQGAGVIAKVVTETGVVGVTQLRCLGKSAIHTVLSVT
jgi:hypothetical protein